MLASSSSSSSKEGPSRADSSPQPGRLAVDADSLANSRDTSRPTTSRSGYAQWATDKPVPQSSADSLVDELDDDSSSETEGGGDSEPEDVDDRHISPSVRGQRISAQDLVYVLDVIQQPQRARACGFGDKDRRPLSPPPVIQLRIFDKAGNTIPPHLVDFHRLILMVDLWNGDQTQQRSIVMHPGARPEPQSSQNVYPARATSQPQRFDAPPQSTFSRTLLRSGGGFVGPGPEWDGYGRRLSAPPQPYGVSPRRQSVMGWPPPPSGHDGSGDYPRHDWYDDPRASLSTRPTLAHTDSLSAARSLSGDSRVWTPEPLTDYPGERAGSYFSGYPSSTAEWAKDSPYGRDRYHDWDRMYPGGSAWSSSGDSHRSRAPTGGPLFTHAPSPMSQQAALPLTSSPPSIYQDTYPERSSGSSHYSGVLVGSLGAVCQRLKGLDNEAGLFFFTHDLGIRTEGNFSLRFTLVDLSTLMMHNVVKDQSVPTLARVCSDTFTVYSAKRFPGVLPTTELTQCFADQGVRLPTRQKRAHAGGTSGSKRKK